MHAITVRPATAAHRTAGMPRARAELCGGCPAVPMTGGKPSSDFRRRRAPIVIGWAGVDPDKEAAFLGWWPGREGAGLDDLALRWPRG